MEFFCSYGVGIDYYSDYFKNFVRGSVVENKKCLQSKNTNVCGQYAIYFLYKRLDGCCRMSLYCNFSDNKKKNDMLVNKFVRANNHLLHGHCKFLKINQCCTMF